MLLCFALFAISRLCLVSLSSVFIIGFMSCIFIMNGTV